MKNFCITLFTVSFLLTTDVQAGNVEEVRAKVDRLIALEHQFDVSMFDVYLDETQFYMTRIYPGGIKKNRNFLFKDVKEIFIKTMPLAKRRNDYKTYSNIQVIDNDGIVTVIGDAYSHLKKYEAPFKSVWIKDRDGQWKIFEEHLVSKAF